MDTRLIFLDIDGTFIEPGRTEAPASAAEAVRAARANGHKVFLCTGRNYRMTSPLLRYGFDGYVCSAGGYVVCGQEVLFDCPMDRAQSDGVRALLETHGVDCTLEAKNATYGGARMLERFAGYQARRQGAAEPPVGYIGEVKKFCCHRCPLVGETLCTTVTMGAEAGGVTLLTGETRIGNETVASTQMKIFVGTPH